MPDGQNLSSSRFIGSAANETLLTPRFKYYPEASLMHTDGGNTGSSDAPGPLGMNPNTTSAASTVNMMVWGTDGSLTCGYVNTSAGNPPPRGIAALEPETFEILAVWYPPDNETISFAYMEYIEKTNDILLSSEEGHIYVIHRDTCNGRPYFTTIRTISLANTLGPEEPLLNTMYDVAGNIWFTSGGLIGAGGSEQNSSTIGYITPTGKIIKQRLQNEMVENGIAVSGMDIYMVTGPSGSADHANATGYMYSMKSDECDSIKIHWRVPYAAGSGIKLGATARGSDTTPVLLTDKYVVIADNDSPRAHLNVYHQKAQKSKKEQLACQMPLFTSGKSNVMNSALAHFDGETHGVLVQNKYGGPDVYVAQPGKAFDVNGNWNDMSTMDGGLARIDVDADGKCSMRWTSDLAVKAVSILSTKTGLVYSYVQDTERSPKGEYVWYVAGIDWDTGKTIFKVQTGTGGIFNDNFSQGSIGPDGTFYQSVLGGVVGVKDGQ
ncbi:hypothetical protein NW762_011463 [Fusarium torreyae]|uniref:Uncharacterized protein n=1 Tax=Fusarium torreyae TaxID=1237075 RepID=A0A9W8RSH7_9HYPO|nr:hypothetical protein NW762_011463 [Fusarium torreyae]